MEYQEIIGYVASGVILLSILVSNVRRFRILNGIGAAVYTGYGLFIESYPVAIMNFIILLIDVYYLLRISNKKEFFDINEELQGTESFVKLFLNYHKKDISKFFPTFDFASIQNPKLILVSRNINPVGLFIYEENAESNEIIIHLDFACPNYRDTKNFFYLFNEKAEDFRARGFKKFVTTVGTRVHKNYLKVVGFQKVDSRFEMEITT